MTDLCREVSEPLEALGISICFGFEKFCELSTKVVDLGLGASVAVEDLELVMVPDLALETVGEGSVVVFVVVVVAGLSLDDGTAVDV